MVRCGCTRCGLVRIARTELDAWIADPKRRIETTALGCGGWGEAPLAVAPSEYDPPVAKSTDGRLWFVTGEGVQVVDPRHLAVNESRRRCTSSRSPPTARYDHASWRTWPADCHRWCAMCDRLHRAQPGGAGEGPVPLQAGGSGQDWQEVVNQRHVHYYQPAAAVSYRFRVMAANNSGVWNEQARRSTSPLRPRSIRRTCFARCAPTLLAAAAVLWAAYRARMRIVERHAAEISALNERLDEGAGAGADPDRRRAARQRHAADHRAEPRPGHGETADRRRLGSEGDGRRRAAQADRRRDRGP